LSDTRLMGEETYRWYIAYKNAFADFEHPTTLELNANPTNDPAGLIFNITCALDQGSSQFDLDDPDTDDSLTFCQRSGDKTPKSQSATVVLAANMAEERWLVGSSLLAANGFNTATLTQSLLTWRGIDMYAILSIGKAPSAVFAVGDRVKIAEISTDHVVPNIGSGNNVTLVQTPAKRTDINWNYELAA